MKLRTRVVIEAAVISISIIILSAVYAAREQYAAWLYILVVICLFALSLLCALILTVYWKDPRLPRIGTAVAVVVATVDAVIMASAYTNSGKGVMIGIS